jgi:Terminase large subunit, T4likevirus-type, N-terminal
MAGQTADRWQSELVRTPAPRTLLCCSRSAGKSTAAAALALAEALTRPRSLALILSPTERQSAETMLKVLHFYRAAGRPVATAREAALELRLGNGSRLIALPGNERTVRTYNGVTLLILDEAARVPDELYLAVRPMLAVAGGRLLALSTPFGQRGWFWESWRSSEPWDRVRITAHDCPRIPGEFLEEERRSMGDRWFRQEYECSFEAAADAVFDPLTVDRALRNQVVPLW